MKVSKKIVGIILALTLVLSQFTTLGNIFGFGVIMAKADGVQGTTPPAPTNVICTSNTDTTIDLAWTTSTDSAGVTGYDIYRDGTEIGNASTASYTDSGLSASTSYTYTVKAEDTAGKISDASSPVSFTTANPSGATAPTAPTNVISSSQTDTTVSLLWTASTDDTGISSYDIFRNGAIIGNSSNTTYTDTGLSTSSTYTYTVKAKGSTGYVSDASIPVSFTTANPSGITAPTAPANLTSSSQTDTTVSLSWTASTDTTGISSYEIFRDGAEIGNSTGTAYTDTGLSASTTYTYTVRATDSNGYISDASSPESFTTDNPSGVTAPTVPTNLACTSNTETSISLSWTASTDDAGISSYEIFRNGAEIGSSPNTTYIDSGLSASITYTYTVKAEDTNGYISDASSTLDVTTPDTTPPTAPADLTCSSKTGTTVTLTWTASTDNVGVSGYDIYRDGIEIGYTSNMTYTDSGLSEATTYTYTIQAEDTAANLSDASNALNVMTSDTTPPTAPTEVTCTSNTETTVTLTWTASTDNVGVTSYDIYRNGSKVGSTANTTYTDSGLSVSTSYTYTVKAEDAVGNISDASSALNVTTPDTTPPTAPTDVACSSKTDTTVTLTWTASTDNVGVTCYDVYRNGMEIGSTSVTSYTDAGLSASTAYTYTVKSEDAAGNVSDASSAFNVTTANPPDTTPPTAPTNVTYTSVTDTSVTLTWTASTDNVGVTDYNIYRDGNEIGSTTGTTYTDSDLGAGTYYAYTVKAEDAAGNLSDASNPVSVTTTVS
jgi:chitodextrinase